MRLEKERGELLKGRTLEKEKNETRVEYGMREREREERSHFVNKYVRL